MLPRELPISDEADAAARKAIFGELADEAPYDVRRGVEAFLRAEGFEVEKIGFDSVTNGPAYIRLVGPRRAPSSTEGGEGT